MRLALDINIKTRGTFTQLPDSMKQWRDRNCLKVFQQLQNFRQFLTNLKRFNLVAYPLQKSSAPGRIRERLLFKGSFGDISRVHNET